MKQLYLGSLLLLIAGCTHAPKYAPPEDAPQAQIRSELVSMDNRRNNLTLFSTATMGCKFGSPAAVIPGRELFSVNKNKSTPEGFRAIEAGKPISLVLSGSVSPDRYCNVSFIGEFTPGAHYVIKGGIVGADLEHLGSCELSIVDLNTGAVVPLTKISSPAPNNCALGRLMKQAF